MSYGDYNGDWERFLTEIYSIFVRDFKQSNPRYQGLKLIFDSRLENDKEMAFWHLIQREDRGVKDRLLELRRCERIPWPKPIIEHPSENCISVWENSRKRQNRILLWLEELDYLVVLGKRPKEIVLITAYCTDVESQRRKLIKERDTYLNAKAAP